MQNAFAAMGAAAHVDFHTSLDDQTTLFAGYDLELRNRATSHGVQAGIKVAAAGCTLPEQRKLSHLWLRGPVAEW